MTKDRDTATARAAELDQKFAQASKTAAELAAAQKMIATLKQDKKASTKAAAEFDGKLADAQQQMAALAKDRDAAVAQVATLNGKLADAQKEIATVKSDRDQIAAQRDQALADLDKARAAGKKVDDLIAQNATLMQKLADAREDDPQFQVRLAGEGQANRRAAQGSERDQGAPDQQPEGAGRCPGAR